MTNDHATRRPQPRRQILTLISAPLQRASLAALISVTVTLLERRMQKAFDGRR
jgi:hypothetical protein